MKLASVELRGFKSFFRRTKIDFTHGITALVGPNGCGKTNIVDAIRWVLGELSPGLLRCEKMEDVIFSGAAEKEALGAAEVTLTISNDDGGIPLEYSEVAITRRVYRSGESEYYINRNLCRLKDIHNMLLNTGISHRTYSVFENAMIDRILSRDPTYKRLFFEEAAKIAKYRERKNDALRKMDATENDIRNLKEIITEAERYTSSLRRQANKARRYAELCQRLSYLKASLSKDHYNELKELIATLSKGFEQLKMEKSELLERLSKGEKELEGTKSELDIVEESIEELEQQLRTMDGSIREFEKDVVSYRERINAEKEKSKRGRKELDFLHKVREKTQVTIAGSRTKLDETRKEMETAKRLLSETEQKLEALERDDLTRRRDDLRKEEMQASKRAIESESSLERGVARITSIESEMERLSRDAESAAQSVKRTEESSAAFAKEEESLAHKMEKIEAKREALKKELVQLEGRLARISAQLAVEIPSLPLSVESRHPLLRDCVSMLPKYEKAITGALGIRLLAPLLHTSEDLLDIVERLRNEKASRSVLLSRRPQLSTSPKLPEEPSVLGRATDFVEVSGEAREIVNWLLSDFVVVTDFPAALKHAEVHPHLSFATLEGDVLESDGTVWTGLFEEEQRDALDELRSTHTRLRDELLTVESELKSFMKQRSDVEIGLAKLEAERSRSSSTLQQLEVRSSSLAVELKKAKREVSLLEKRLAEEKKRLSELREKLEHTETSLSAVGRDRDALVAERNDLLVRLKVSEERIHTIGREIERDQVSIEESGESIERLEEELEKSLSSTRDLESVLNRKFSKLESLIKERNSILEEKSESEKEKSDVKERLEYISERRKLMQTDLDRVSETLHQTEMKLMELTKERSSLRENIAHEYKIDLEQFVAEAPPDPEEIEKLDRVLQRIGNVNPLAAQDYEREKQRLDFLRVQLNDLMMAKKYLLDTLAIIDERASSQFQETFTKVRANFRTVFGRLFEGGVADLRLGDGGDPFNSSVELVANPKGKNLKTLDALSGGERALVAIAFLFALYLCRPSPFCILDEIDAALDDANVARFLTFLDDLSHNTQFLIVTHNKRTMEAANSLYGITMEEPGISKVVSVKLRE